MWPYCLQAPQSVINRQQSRGSRAGYHAQRLPTWYPQNNWLRLGGVPVTRLRVVASINPIAPIDLPHEMARAATTVEQCLDVLLPPVEGAEGRLAAAMRYATLGGGKRLRAFLVIETAALFGVNETCAARVAASVEMMHAYSLVHDDLPAMDDDDLRRGKPSTHKAFD